MRANSAAGTSCATRTAADSLTPPTWNAYAVMVIHTANSATRKAAKARRSRRNDRFDPTRRNALPRSPPALIDPG